MRLALRRRMGRFLRYRATFERFGERYRNDHPPVLTLLFIDVRDRHGNAVADHLWIQDRQPFDDLKLCGGERVEFYASVSEYVKKDGTMDYRLLRPQFVKRVR